MTPVSRPKLQPPASAGSGGGSVPKPTLQRPTGLFQTVVFSRKTTSNGPTSEQAVTSGMTATALRKQALLANAAPPSPLAGIVHQTDRSGTQNGATNTVTTGRGTPPRRLQREGSGSGSGGSGSFRNLFANIWSALGVSEQQSQQQSRKSSSSGKPGAPSPSSSRNVIELRKSVLPPLAPEDAGKKCLVLDLDETLVHSSFKPTTNPDYIIPVDIDGTVHQVYVCKRPGVDDFLVEMAKYYEIVIYTASLSKYANPLLDRLDPHHTIKYRLFREHCAYYEGNYVKDLSLLDRDITQSIIIDNSPLSYLFHPRNAIGCSSFIDDPNDRELDSISRFLTNTRAVDDVRDHMHEWDADY